MRGLNILLIHRDPVFLVLLQHELSRLGYLQVRGVSTAIEALALLHSALGFNCVLLAADVASADGVSLCRRIRTVPQHAATPILMISDVCAPKAIETAFSDGATDYLTKPLCGLELRARVGMAARLMEERRRREVLAARLHNPPDAPAQHPRFSDPIPVTGLPHIVDYSALENYVQALGRQRLHAHASLAFRIGNAEDIFAASDAMSYADVLGHVAGVVSDMLKDREFLMAHAGRGEFVCVMARHLPLAPHLLAQDIAMRLADRSRIYSRLCVPHPVVQVGEPTSIGFFSRAAPTELLGRAREKLRAAAARRSLQAEVFV